MELGILVFWGCHNMTTTNVVAYNRNLFSLCSRD